MPSRAARWISWITSRLKIAPSRNPGRQPRPAERRSTSSRALPSVSNSVIARRAAGRGRAASVRARVVDIEVVELARRAVAAEIARGAVLHLRALEQRRQLSHVLVAHGLLHAVGAEPGHAPAHVQMSLVDGVAERVARVAAYHEAAPLRHERAHVPNRAVHHDVHALHRYATAGRRATTDH